MGSICKEPPAIRPVNRKQPLKMSWRCCNVARPRRWTQRLS